VKPGEYEVENGITLLAVLAVAGGPTEYADLKSIKISRTGQEDQAVAEMSTFEDAILSDGDGYVVAQSFR